MSSDSDPELLNEPLLPPEYVEKPLFDHVVHQLLVKIARLEERLEVVEGNYERLRLDNGSMDGLYRKMDELLTEMRFAAEDNMCYYSE